MGIIVTLRHFVASFGLLLSCDFAVARSTPQQITIEQMRRGRVDKQCLAIRYSHTVLFMQERWSNMEETVTKVCNGKWS